jgi:predicted DNA binding CopG/RHH family protein
MGFDKQYQVKNLRTSATKTGNLKEIAKFIGVSSNMLEKLLANGATNIANCQITMDNIDDYTENNKELTKDTQPKEKDQNMTPQTILNQLKKNPRVQIKTVLEWLDSGLIIPYSKNRSANGALNKLVDNSRVLKIARDFKPGAIGSIRIGLHNGNLTIADGHHRAFAIQKLKELEMIDVFGNREMIVDPIEDEEFLQVYTGTNNSRSHSLADKLSNSDLPYSAFLRKILKDVNIPDRKSFLPNVSDALCGFALAISEKEVMSVAHLYAGRSYTELYANSMDDNELGEIINPKNKAIFYKALQFYSDVLKSIESYSGYSSEGAKKLLGSPGLLMLIVSDILGQKKLEESGPDMVAFSAVFHWNDTVEAMTCIARRNIGGRKSSEFSLGISTAYKLLLGGSNKSSFRKKYTTALKEKKKRLGGKLY